MKWHRKGEPIESITAPKSPLQPVFLPNGRKAGVYQQLLAWEDCRDGTTLVFLCNWVDVLICQITHHSSFLGKDMWEVMLFQAWPICNIFKCAKNVHSNQPLPSFYCSPGYKIPRQKNSPLKHLKVVFLFVCLFFYFSTKHKSMLEKPKAILIAVISVWTIQSFFRNVAFMPCILNFVSVVDFCPEHFKSIVLCILFVSEVWKIVLTFFEGVITSSPFSKIILVRWCSTLITL